MIKHIKIFGIGFVLLGAMAGQASGQEPLKIRNVEEAVELALKHNAGIQGASLARDASRVRRATAFELPKLELSGQYGKTDGPANNLKFEISQSIPFPTVFTAKRRLLKAQFNVSESSLALKQMELGYQVRSLIQSALWAKAKLDRLNHLDSIATTYSKLHEIKERAGESSPAEHKLVKLKQMGISMQARDCALELKQHLNSLATLMGTSQEVVLEGIPFAPLRDVQDVVASSDGSHPRLDAIQHEIDVAQAEQSRIKAELLPDLTLGYQNQSSVGEHDLNGQSVYHGIGDRFSSASVGISIPLDFGASRAKVRSAKLEASAKRSELEEARLGLENERRNNALALRLRTEQYQYYYKTALPAAQEIIQSNYLAYKAGDINYIEYLLAFEEANQTFLSALESLYRLNLTILEQDFLLGR